MSLHATVQPTGGSTESGPADSLETLSPPVPEPALLMKEHQVPADGRTYTASDQSRIEMAGRRPAARGPSVTTRDHTSRPSSPKSSSDRNCPPDVGGHAHLSAPGPSRGLRAGTQPSTPLPRHHTRPAGVSQRLLRATAPGSEGHLVAVLAVLTARRLS